MSFCHLSIYRFLRDKWLKSIYFDISIRCSFSFLSTIILIKSTLSLQVTILPIVNSVVLNSQPIINSLTLPATPCYTKIFCSREKKNLNFWNVHCFSAKVSLFYYLQGAVASVEERRSFRWETLLSSRTDRKNSYIFVIDIPRRWGN